MYVLTRGFFSVIPCYYKRYPLDTRTVCMEYNNQLCYTTIKVAKGLITKTDQSINQLINQSVNQSVSH